MTGEIDGLDYALGVSGGADLIQLDSFHLIVGVKSHERLTSCVYKGCSAGSITRI